MDCLKSSKAEYVSQHAPESCQIWFVCRGHLVLTAQRLSDRVDETETEPHPESSVSSSLTSSSFADTGFALVPHPSDVTPLSEDSSERRTDDRIYSQLEQSMADAEKFRRESYEESIKRFEAEKNAFEAIRKSREYEAMYREEVRLRKETERNLLEEKEGHERATIERDEAISRCSDAQRLQHEAFRSRKEAEEECEKLRQERENLNKGIEEAEGECEKLRQEREILNKRIEEAEEECEKLRQERENLSKRIEEAISSQMECQQLLQNYADEQDKLREERDEAIRAMEEILKIVDDDSDSSGSDDQPPPYFMCPISQDIMKDPQFAADGHTYEAENVREWFERGNNTSPMTNLELQHLNLVPNLALRSAIQEWLLRHPDSS